MKCDFCRKRFSPRKDGTLYMKEIRRAGWKHLWGFLVREYFFDTVDCLRGFERDHPELAAK